MFIFHLSFSCRIMYQFLIQTINNARVYFGIYTLLHIAKGLRIYVILCRYCVYDRVPCIITINRVYKRPPYTSKIELMSPLNYAKIYQYNILLKQSNCIVQHIYGVPLISNDVLWPYNFSKDNKTSELTSNIFIHE